MASRRIPSWTRCSTPHAASPSPRSLSLHPCETCPDFILRLEGVFGVSHGNLAAAAPHKPGLQTVVFLGFPPGYVLYPSAQVAIAWPAMRTRAQVLPGAAAGLQDMVSLVNDPCHAGLWHTCFFASTNRGLNELPPEIWVKHEFLRSNKLRSSLFLHPHDTHL